MISGSMPRTAGTCPHPILHSCPSAVPPRSHCCQDLALAEQEPHGTRHHKSNTRCNAGNGIAAFGSLASARIPAFLAGVYAPLPPPKHEPDYGDDDDDAGDGGTCDDDDSGEQQCSSRRRTATATEICLNVTESLDELAKSQADEHNDEPQRRTTVRQADHSTILITALY